MQHRLIQHDDRMRRPRPLQDGLAAEAHRDVPAAASSSSPVARKAGGRTGRAHAAAVVAGARSGVASDGRVCPGAVKTTPTPTCMPRAPTQPRSWGTSRRTPDAPASPAARRLSRTPPPVTGGLRSHPCVPLLRPGAHDGQSGRGNPRSRPAAARVSTASGHGHTMATGDIAPDPFSRPAQYGRSRSRRCAASGCDDRHQAGLRPRADGTLRSSPGSQGSAVQKQDRRSANAGDAEVDA